MIISGIYKIQSTIKPERIYIGSAININNRWMDHLSRLKKSNHINKKLQNHFNKYGEADLRFSILLGCEKSYLIINEQFFIDSYKPFFNIRLRADSNLGIKLSEEHKLKISKANKGKIRSTETKRKISETQKGVPKPRKYIRTLSEAHKRNISESHKGLHLSKETKRKIGLVHKNKFVSETTRHKISITKKGNTNVLGKHWNMSDETKERIRNATKGKPKSKKAIENMRGRIPWNKGLKIKQVG